MLTRCCDVSAHCQSLNAGEEPLPNPYAEPLPAHQAHAVRPPISPVVAELLYNRTGSIPLLCYIEKAEIQEHVLFFVFYCWYHM